MGLVTDKKNVPSPDDIDAWVVGPPKKVGRLRRLFARKTIDVQPGVGESATKAGPGGLKADAGDKREASQQDVPLPPASDQRFRPRRIEFASGVLERDPVEVELAVPTGHAAGDLTEGLPGPRLAGITGQTNVLPPLRLDSSSYGTFQERPVIEARGFALFSTDVKRRELGSTPSEEDLDGTAHIYRVVGPEGVELELGDIMWENGERSLTVLDRLSSPSMFDGLVRRLRMTVQPVEGEVRVVELSAARFMRLDRPSLVKSEIPILSDEIGVDVIRALSSAGALRVGTKEDVLGVRHTRRGYWCATFDPAHTQVPAAAFLLVRILPVHLRLRG
jgi:hypothetical protein